MFQLIPIAEYGEAPTEPPMGEFGRSVCEMTVAWYRRSGFVPPWIGYFAQREGVWVGACGFKGGPQGGRVEIAYCTFPEFEGEGIGTSQAAELIAIARRADPAVFIAAQSLPMESASTSILKKLGFGLWGTVHDPEDGEVWEWRLGGGPKT
jgi:RimJ/RimL family protein N-acetyltransferase